MKAKALLCLALSWFSLLWAVPSAFAGSPFYLTVEKSFANTEKPQIRLDYTRTDPPMLVRVLKPKNLDSFLDGQFNISRSYEKPITELNPGSYFVKGLNKLKSPLKTFRDMLDVDFRKSFKDTQLHQSVLTPTDKEVASAPEQMIIGAPDGFTVVREFYVDLRYGGKSVNDLGWWFADSAWDEDRYKVRTISLDPLPDGIYLIHAVQDKAEAQSLLQVSSLSVQVKQSTSQLVVRVMDRKCEPVKEATIRFRDGRGKWIPVNQKTDESGELSFSNPEGTLDGKLLVQAETRDSRQAVTDTDFLPTVSTDDSVFIVTDRPIFKPGETFFYKGIIRAFDHGELKVPDVANKKADISLIRADGAATDLSKIVDITDFGTFSGGFDLDVAEMPGLFRLVADISGKPYGGEFRVRDYVKPVFYIEMMDRAPTVVSGEKFFVKFQARRYSGGAPSQVKYEVYLYRKKYEAPQWVVEAGAGLSAGADYYGEVRSVSGLTEPKRIYSSAEERLGTASVDVNTWDSAPVMEASGEARFEFVVPLADAAKENQPPPEEWIYTLMIRAMDKAGSQAVFTDDMYVTLSEAQALVRFSRTVADAGEKDAAVLVRSTYPDGKPAPRASGVMDVALEKIGAAPQKLPKISFATNDQGTAKISLPAPAGPGRLSAVATLETLDGKPMKQPSVSQAAYMIIAGPQGAPILDTPDIELYTDKTILSPGEKIKVLALLPAGWGEAETGVVWETLAGSKVYSTHSEKIKGRSQSFEVEAKKEYGTGFYHTVTVPVSGGKFHEKTTGFRIIPVNKRLQITVSPERPETEPLKPFKIDFNVADADGKPSPDTELAVTIVDRAVYAVQTELRPNIFDFFYPLSRLNLSTFYSDELQGYGYADTLKKPNFKLGALKSQSKLVKKNMRDTAGWFPHVVTDSTGHASVLVDMPANVTEWVITAIAADKTGRAGESKGGFRTVSDLSVEAVAPQFLREKESAVIFIKTINHLDKEIPVKERIELSPEIVLTETAAQPSPLIKDEQGNFYTVEFTLEKQGERLIPLGIEAKSGQGAGIVKASLSTPEKIRVPGADEFEIPLKPAAMTQTFAGRFEQDRLITALPKTGTVRQLKVQVASGLLGAALNAAEVLVTYPFGCTEQLVHTTIPNLVLMDLVKRAGIEAKDLGPLSKPLKDAEKNAAAGIKKIILNQKTNGGFSLWPSDPEPSVPVTVTALYALGFAGRLDIEGASAANSAYYTGERWLRQSLQNASGQSFTGYELAMFSELHLYPPPFDQLFTYIDKVRASANAPVSDVIYALKIFAAYKDQSWNRLNQQYKDGKVKNELIERLKTGLEQFDTAAYVKAAKADARLFESMGFSYGVSYLISAGLGVLKDVDAYVPPDLEAKLTHVLTASLRNGYWTSTFDTAQVIFNTRAILSEEAAAYQKEKNSRTQTITVHGTGGVIGELARIPAGFVGTFANPGTAESLSTLRLEGIMEKDVGYSSISADIPFDAIAPHSHGLAVERTFLKITPQGHEILDASKPLQKGDVIISAVHVKRSPLDDAKAVPSQFIVVEDAIPSYAQGIDEDRTYLADARLQRLDDTYWASIKEVRRYPDKTITIARATPTGELVVYQVWKTAFDGKAMAAPARAYDMYDESIQGNSDVGQKIP